MVDRYTATEMASAAMVSPATLDHWAAVGLLTPSIDGAYSANEMARGLVYAELARLGVPTMILCGLAEQLTGDAWRWPEHLWISAGGIVDVDDFAAASWVVHPRRVLVKSGPAILNALLTETVAGAA